MRLLHLFIIVCLGIATIVVYVVDLLDPTSGANNDSNLLNVAGRKRYTDDMIIGDKYENIFWFVQISDLHISKFHDLRRGPDVIQFCRNYLSVIKPEVILATGDLVDAKSPGGVGSSQYIEEWEKYRDVLTECSKYHEAKWLDVRGNHDSFDVPNLKSDENRFRKYSAQGGENARSYMYTHSTSFGKYTFIAVDACPDPGPKRPFNFFGQLDADEMTDLQKYADRSKDSNLTIWFGHYPTSLIVQDVPGIKYVMRNGIAYLCGHLHTLHGLVPNMYTRHKTGTLELELGDWRDYRKFRVMAVDHDLLSFVDFRLGDWPLVIITNPKHALLQTELHEPLHRMINSSHIRILVFHAVDIKSVSVYLDDRYMGDADNVKGPLYTQLWNPHSYSIGSHTVRVSVKDGDGNKKDFQQPFSLDGTKPDFLLTPRFILMMNISAVGKVMFAVLILMYVIVLVFLRKCYDISILFLEGNTCFHRFINSWMWKLWLSTRSNRVYYPIIGAVLYITVGPWFVGDFLRDHVGILFVWGIYVNGSFIPGSHTYFYGTFQMITFHIPVLLHIGHTLDLLYCHKGKLREAKDLPASLLRRTCQSYLPFLVILIFQCYLAFTEFPKAYGTKAMIIGPVRTGSVFFLLYLQHVLTKRSPLSCELLSFKKIAHCS